MYQLASEFWFEIKHLARDIQIPIVKNDALIIAKTVKAFSLKDKRKELILSVKHDIEWAFESL